MKPDLIIELIGLVTGLLTEAIKLISGAPSDAEAEKVVKRFRAVTKEALEKDKQDAEAILESRFP